VVRAQVEQPVLDEQWAAFIQGGVSIAAASRDSHNVPVTSRALGCRASGNRHKVTLLFSRQQAESLMNAISSNGAIAVVFSQPSSHVSIQVKGSDAAQAASRTQDVQVFKRYAEAFVKEVIPLGYPEGLIRTLLWADPADLVTVTFTPTAAFLQTPGPRAGESLRS
jgi:hypothetical protein